MTTDWARCRQILDEGIRALGLVFPATVHEQLIAYLQELDSWNRSYNLTAVRNPEEMVTKHLLDSLAVLPHLSGNRIIDVGTGAGLPGIPLALGSPERQFTLLDSNGKKAAFLRHAQRTLKLDNVTVVQSRVEDYAEGRGRFDSVLSRAFTSLAEMIELAGALCARNGLVIAMKGRFPDDELEELQLQPSGFKLHDTVQLQVPGLAAERHLVLFSRV